MLAKNWSRHRLGDLLVTRDTKAVNDGRFPHYSLTIESGLVPKPERYNREFLVRDTAKKYKRIEPNDLVYNPGNLRWGAIALCKAPSTVIASPIYEVLSVRVGQNVDPAYLYLAISTPEWIALYEKFAEGTLVERTAVKPETFLAFELALPPLWEQRKIAAILGSVAEAIEGTQAVIEQLQVVKKAMMADLLTRGIPGRHSKFKMTEIGEVPEAWEVMLGEELFSLSGGYSPSDLTFVDNGAALFLKVDDFNRPANRRGLRESALRYEPDQNPRIRTCTPGQLVFPKRGAAISKNRVQVLQTPATVDPNLMVLAPGDRIDAEFFAYSILHIGLHNLSDNSGIPQINNKHLYPHSFAVPPLREQAMIREALSAVDERLEAELSGLEGVMALKSALMSVLLTGEVRVQPDGEAA